MAERRNEKHLKQEEKYMAKIGKHQLKNQVVDRVSKLIDGAEAMKSLEFFEITIKHINGDLLSGLETKHKEKVKE